MPVVADTSVGDPSGLQAIWHQFPTLPAYLILLVSTNLGRHAAPATGLSRIFEELADASAEQQTGGENPKEKEQHQRDVLLKNKSQHQLAMGYQLLGFRKLLVLVVKRLRGRFVRRWWKS